MEKVAVMFEEDELIWVLGQPSADIFVSGGMKIVAELFNRYNGESEFGLVVDTSRYPLND